MSAYRHFYTYIKGCYGIVEKIGRERQNWLDVSNFNCLFRYFRQFYCLNLNISRFYLYILFLYFKLFFKYIYFGFSNFWDFWRFRGHIQALNLNTAEIFHLIVDERLPCTAIIKFL